MLFQLFYWLKLRLEPLVLVNYCYLTTSYSLYNGNGCNIYNFYATYSIFEAHEFERSEKKQEVDSDQTMSASINYIGLETTKQKVSKMLTTTTPSSIRPINNTHSGDCKQNKRMNPNLFLINSKHQIVVNAIEIGKWFIHWKWCEKKREKKFKIHIFHVIWRIQNH